MFTWERCSMTCIRLPHSEIPGSKVVCTSPRLIAAYHVLHRLLVPRHPPGALTSLTENLTQLVSTVTLAANLLRTTPPKRLFTCSKKVYLHIEVVSRCESVFDCQRTEIRSRGSCRLSERFTPAPRNLTLQKREFSLLRALGWLSWWA